MAALVAALAIGCQILVPGEPTNVRCTEEGAVGPPVCPLGTFCMSGKCEPGPPALGEPCAGEGTCARGDRCFDPEEVGFAGEPLCSHPCCSSADCGVGTGLVCAVLGPGKMCVPAATWGRGELGEGYPGAPCETGDECRSGVCKDGRVCADACCTDAECASAGAVCRDEGAGWECGIAPPAAGAFPAACVTDGDCASSLCVKWPDGLHRCAEPCCSSTACGIVKVGDLFQHIGCVPVPHGPSLVLACAAIVDGPADRALGQPCESGGDCRGGRCIEVPALDTSPGAARKVCSDVCCTDASCGAPHLFSCQPSSPSEPPSGASPPPPGLGFDLQCTPR
ncbi:MAG: hypothetical protein R3B70_31285 [Polyangiaceae bacterium]